MDKPNRGITRRRIAAAALAAPVLAQTPEPKPVSDTEAAQAQVRQNGEQLRKFRTPLLLEPSFMFRA